MRRDVMPQKIVTVDALGRRLVLRMADGAPKPSYWQKVKAPPSDAIQHHRSHAFAPKDDVEKSPMRIILTLWEIEGKPTSGQAYHNFIKRESSKHGMGLDAVKRLLAAPPARKGKKMSRREGYLAYLATNKWALKKSEYYNSDRPKQCHVCGNKVNAPFDFLHHPRATLGEEKLTDIVPVCEDCKLHIKRKRDAQGGKYWEIAQELRAMHRGLAPPRRERDLPKKICKKPQFDAAASRLEAERALARREAQRRAHAEEVARLAEAAKTAAAKRRAEEEKRRGENLRKKQERKEARRLGRQMEENAAYAERKRRMEERKGARESRRIK